MPLLVGPNDASALHDELLRSIPAGARHDADICPFCVDKATQLVVVPPSVPSGTTPSDVDSHRTLTVEGGTTNMTIETPIETLSKETHLALLDRALAEATATTEEALGRKTEEAAELAAKVAELETASAALKADNVRLNSELDTAQVALKSATDEASSLKAANDEAAALAAKTEIASVRAEQVKNLALFTPEYVTEKAAAWADLADDAWNDRVEEWKALKPATTTDSKPSDTASAMTGTTEGLATEPVVDTAKAVIPARRAALGLTS